MKNLQPTEIYLISGGACKTEVTALSFEANAYVDKIPKPLPNTCTITGDINIPGFINSGGVIGGRQGLSLQAGGIKFACKCSDEYPNDIFIVTKNHANI